MLKVRKLGNEQVQNHPFGDYLKPQVAAELSLRGLRLRGWPWLE
jgi:hypothetical protein